MMCPECGAFIDEEDVWCPECDTFLDDEFIDDDEPVAYDDYHMPERQVYD